MAGSSPASPPRTPDSRSLDDLRGPEEHVLGDGEAERLGGFEVDDELELARCPIGKSACWRGIAL
jgi:hypothetical protein